MTDPTLRPRWTNPDADALPVRPRRKGIYVLPNAITLAALFGGLLRHRDGDERPLRAACIGIFCAVLDSLDGRVARMTNTQSAFGEQMDSLSDMVSFGAAPALIVYEWALKDLGKLGWIAAFVYMRRSAALRLARFNTNIGVVDKRFFQGLPSPAAAALVTGLIWVMDDAGFKGRRAHRLAGLDGIRRHAVRRPDDGHQRAVLQLQGRRRRRTVPFVVHRGHRAGHRGDQPASAAGAVRAVLRLRPVGLRGLRLAQDQGQAGQRDRHLTDEPDERGLH
jgi:CDP-diacylglycerol--serine O-phosphatidyltransferase